MSISDNFLYKIPSFQESLNSVINEVFVVNGIKFKIRFFGTNFEWPLYFFISFLGHSSRKTVQIEGSFFSPDLLIGFSEIMTFTAFDQFFHLFIPSLTFGDAKKGDFSIHFFVYENPKDFSSLSLNPNSTTFPVRQLAPADFDQEQKIGAIQTFFDQTIEIFVKVQKNYTDFYLRNSSPNQNENLLLKFEVRDTFGILNTYTRKLTLLTNKNFCYSSFRCPTSPFLQSSSLLSLLLIDESTYVLSQKITEASSSHSESTGSKSRPKVPKLEKSIITTSFPQNDRNASSTPKIDILPLLNSKASVLFNIPSSMFINSRTFPVGCLQSNLSQRVDILFEFSYFPEKKNLLFGIGTKVKNELIHFFLEIKDQTTVIDSSDFSLPFSVTCPKLEIELWPEISTLLSGNISLRISILE